MYQRGLALAVVLVATAVGVSADEKKDADWEVLFNAKDTTGWKLRAAKVTRTTFIDADGKPIAGARRGKVDQKEVVRDAKGKDIPDAKVIEKDGRKVIVDAEGKPIEKAKIAKVGGRDAIVIGKGEEVKGAKAVNEVVDNASGWTVEGDTLVCSKPHGGNDLLTEKTFTDFELHIEFQATSNSGVYLQGRYEIQIDNDAGRKPGKHSTGAVYGRIAPSKNMGKKPPQWQTYHVTYRAPRGKDGKVTEKARVTLVWNGEKVIDDAEIDGPTGAALDGKVLEPGPLLLQGDHGRVAFRNIKIRPLAGK
jgi:hypothetical protein